VLGIRAKIGNVRTHNPLGPLHQFRKTCLSLGLVRISDDQLQRIPNEMVELSPSWRGLGLGPAVEIVRQFNIDLHRRPSSQMKRLASIPAP
jgi:hypothetical protein